MFFDVTSCPLINVICEEGVTQKCWMKYEMLLKVALQILGQKFYKNIRKSSLYSHSLLIFIHRTPVFERHPITREIRDLPWPRSTPMGNSVYFYMSSLLNYTLKKHRQSFKHGVR